MMTRLGIDDRHVWRLVGAGAGALAALSVQAAVTSGWRRIREEEPPIDVHDPDTRLLQAIAWAAVTGMLAGVAAIAARRLAASGWRKALGRLPPA